MNTELEELEARSQAHDDRCGHCSCCDSCGEMCGEGSDLRDEIEQARARLAA